MCGIALGRQEIQYGRFASFFREMFHRSIFLPPSQFEAFFVSAAHTDGNIDATIAVARESLEAVTG